MALDGCAIRIARASLCIETPQPIFDRQIRIGRNVNSIRVCLQNLDELRRLSDDLRRFAHENHNWTHFHRGGILEPIFRTLQERLGV